MIQHHGSFAISIPANWTAPQFQLGQMVQVRERTGQVIGLDYLTPEQAAAADSQPGWWVNVLEPQQLPTRLAANIWGYHESVLQAAPYLTAVSYECRVPVSR